jgi:hypothetical protein
MQGDAAPQSLPTSALKKVTTSFEIAAEKLGPVRFEWVLDDDRVWIVQLHRGVTKTIGGTIYPGHASSEHRFDVAQGLEALRALIGRIPRSSNHGIVLVGHVGVTSHFGDLLRRARIPSRIERSAGQPE